MEKLIGRKRKPDQKARSPGQLKLWDEWEAPSEIHEVAAQFIRANCYDPKYFDLYLDPRQEPSENQPETRFTRFTLSRYSNKDLGSPDCLMID